MRGEEGIFVARRRGKGGARETRRQGGAGETRRTRVHVEEAALCRLHQAVEEPGKLRVATADVRGETRARVVERVDDRERAGAGEAARCNVSGEEFAELLLRVVLREEALDRVLECEVERLGWEVPNDIHRVASPERHEALLTRHAREAVNNAGVPRDLPGDDFRIGVLRLNQQLHALDRSGRSLCNSTGNAARAKVDQELHSARLLGRSRNDKLARGGANLLPLHVKRVSREHCFRRASGLATRRRADTNLLMIKYKYYLSQLLLQPPGSRKSWLRAPCSLWRDDMSGRKCAKNYLHFAPPPRGWSTAAS